MSLFQEGGHFMKKANQQSFLKAVIAVVLTIVSIIAVLIVGTWIARLTNEGITFMGIPLVIIILIAFVFGVALVNSIVRKSNISNIIFTFILLGAAAYFAIYLVRTVATFFLATYIFKLLSLFCVL